MEVTDLTRLWRSHTCVRAGVAGLAAVSSAADCRSDLHFLSPAPAIYA